MIMWAPSGARSLENIMPKIIVDTAFPFAVDGNQVVLVEVGEQEVAGVGVEIVDYVEPGAVEGPEPLRVLPEDGERCDLHRVDVLPEAAGRAEVGDSRSSRDAGPGQGDDSL